MTLDRIVVVGGSIAGVTAAGALRTAGWGGRLALVSEELSPPYSRVPLSKGVLAGTQTAQSAALAALPDDVDVLLGREAIGLRTQERQVILADGSTMEYDGLVIATGARARRLADPGQTGEHVVRTLQDAEAIAGRLATASTAVVVGGGFLGMEVASTLMRHGLAVTVVGSEEPLVALLGVWLSSYIRGVAGSLGLRIIVSDGPVQLVGDPVSGVLLGDGSVLSADLVVSAAGDLPNTEWLTGSGLRIAGGVVVDARCEAAPGIVAAGDVVTRELAPRSFRRTPHWSNAVVQGRAAASTLIDPYAAAYTPDHYFWTEQFGLDVKIAGEPPFVGEPEVQEGDPSERRALLRWSDAGMTTAAVALNFRIPAARLRAMTEAPAPADRMSPLRT
ncbi:NAD(P)/FAD-dependent oxidoreductase [Microbacterium sp. RD1]|uniref:NAD(P)/FAD-dependent oxidoreductase n=1 Tax=Microbacterium sp. RD1 TaxID=3457313 RepID=UPI003FA5E519